MIKFQERDGGLVFTVRVVPNASRSSIAGVQEGALRVRLAAPPVDGAANKELVRVIASALGLRARDVEITRGHASKVKQVWAKGAKADQLDNLGREGD